MKRLLTILLTCLLVLPALAQGEGVKKVAILEVVDREGIVSYGVKLQLRSSLTAAITQTPGYEAYDRVDMAAIFGEHDFQRTGVVNDEQIKKLGEMSGCDYVLITEAVMVDDYTMLLVAKLVDVTTGKIDSSVDTQIAPNAKGIRKGGEELAKQLFIVEEPVVENDNTAQITEAIQAEKERIAAEREALAKARAEEKARLAAEREAERVRREAERVRRESEKAALAKAKADAKERAAEEKARIAAEKQAERERIAAEKQAERERIAAEKKAEREWRRAHPYRSPKVKVLVSGGLVFPEGFYPVYPAGDVIIGWQKTPHWLIGGGIGLTTFAHEEGELYCGQDGYYYDGYCYGLMDHGECNGHYSSRMKADVNRVLPIYFNARLYWFRSKFSPYFNAKIGTTYNLTQKGLDGVYLAPAFGIAIGRFSMAVDGQFWLRNLIDERGEIEPEPFGNVVLRAEWAF
ncbi:MAG: hypothetical protein IJD12_01610 [Tidjanibacter sp.]|nr:hypothetical protein [Tidjanibacter sp.]